jgi:ATP-dependent RNA helicase DeaD
MMDAARDAARDDAPARRADTKSTGRRTPTRRSSPRREEKPGNFGGLPLSDVMLAALTKAGYLEPTPVQAGLIPRALQGIDIMAQAQTGTGKTAAFAIPILEKVEARRQSSRPQAIILVPTRELAVQVRDEVAKLADGRKTSIIALYGGKPVRQQTEQLRRGVDVVVGTPGRVLDHLDRRTLELNDIRFVTLDEADRMLDIGFRPDIEKILRRCPASRQTLILSATIPPPVKRLAERYMYEPEMIDCSPKDIGVETIEQFYFTVEGENKFPLLLNLLKREEPRQAIVFCRTKRGTERLYQRLTRRDLDAAAIHGDLQQRVRDRVMASFKQGELRYLIATDVVGRGIDVSSVSHIINFDIPEFCDDYVHRVGRTGRMGREGIAFTFVTPEEGSELTRIEMRINRLLVRREVADYLTPREPSKSLRSEPSPATTDASASRQAASTREGAKRPAQAAGQTPPSTASASDEPAESADSTQPSRKKVFGRPTRRVRRAL